MEGPLAVILAPARQEEEECARQAAQTLVEAAFRVRTSWPLRKDSDAERIRCVVVLGPNDAELAEVREKDQALAVLLVQDLPRGTAMPATVSEVVPATRIRLDLARIAARWLTEDVLRHVADVFSYSPMMARHPWVRRATVVSLNEKKFHMHTLAADIGCSDRHLRRCWAQLRRESQGGKLLPHSLKKFLDVLLLLHALRDWLSAPPLRARWSHVAQTLGVTEETVRSAMQQLLRIGPSAVGISNVVALVLQLESDLLSPFE